MEDEMQVICADVACEVARQSILRLGGFTCAHDTEINPETLHHIGTCDDCPVIKAEELHEMAAGMICRRERFVTVTPNKKLGGSSAAAGG